MLNVESRLTGMLPLNIFMRTPGGDDQRPTLAFVSSMILTKRKILLNLMYGPGVT